MKRFKIFTSVVILLCVLAVSVSAMELPVIGKATIKKGTALPMILMVTPTRPVPGMAIAFEDQVVYITAKMEAEPGQHRGGYVIDGQGFSHDCPAHGKEVMGMAMIVLPIEEIESGNVTIELF
jgi:hypothetical protein